MQHEENTCVVSVFENNSSYKCRKSSNFVFRCFLDKLIYATYTRFNISRGVTVGAYDGPLVYHL